MVETGHCFAGSKNLPLISYPDVLLTSRRRALSTRDLGTRLIYLRRFFSLRGFPSLSSKRGSSTGLVFNREHNALTLASSKESHINSLCFPSPLICLSWHHLSLRQQCTEYININVCRFLDHARRYKGGEILT